MKVLKIIALVSSLVGIGFVAGFFTHRYIAVQHIGRVAQMRFPPGFEEHLYRIIDADAELQKKLHPIVHHYAGKISSNHIESRGRRKALVDSMHQEIKPLLTDEQIQKLEEFTRRFRAHGKKRKHQREKNHSHDGLKEKKGAH